MVSQEPVDELMTDASPALEEKSIRSSRIREVIRGFIHRIVLINPCLLLVSVLDVAMAWCIHPWGEMSTDSGCSYSLRQPATPLRHLSFLRRTTPWEMHYATWSWKSTKPQCVHGFREVKNSEWDEIEWERLKVFQTWLTDPTSNSPEVEFCGYSIPHPSEPKMNVRIQTYGMQATLNHIDVLQRVI